MKMHRVTKKLKLTCLALSLSLSAIGVASGDELLPNSSDNKPGVVSFEQKQPIIIEQLLHASRVSQAGHLDWAKEASIPEVLIDKDRVLVEIYTQQKSLVHIKNVVSQYGGELKEAFTAQWGEAAIPVKAFQALAVDANIRYVRFARLVHPQAVAEGHMGSRGNWWNSPGGMSGLGVKIGVIDYFDLAALEQQRSRNEVPSARNTVMLPNPRAQSNNHGNQVLEVIHDFAPNAQYVLLPSPSTVSDLRLAIDTAVAQRVNVINASVSSYVDGYNDGQVRPGSVTEKIQQAFNRNVLVVTSAGNTTTSHWSGRFRPTATDRNELDWNYNDFADAPISRLASYAQSLNVLRHPESNSDCIPDGEPIFVDLVKQAIPVGVTPDIAVRLMRQGALAWHTVAYDEGSLLTDERHIAYVANSASDSFGTTGPAMRISGDTGQSSNCRLGTARYAIKVLRRMESSSVSSTLTPVYIQLFVNHNLHLQYRVPQASVQGMATSQYAVTVGAANCNTQTGSMPVVGTGCNNIGVAEYSAQGPIAGPLGVRPNILTGAQLIEQRATLKPDLVSFGDATTSLSRQPNGRYIAFQGTSAATPHVTGMVALMMERDSFLQVAPVWTRYLLLKMANLRGEGDLTSAGYGELNYVYGRGLLRFQKEAIIEFRGRVNHQRSLNSFITTSPPMAPPDGSVSFTDGYDAKARVRFKDSLNRPVFFPVLRPMISLMGGASGTLPSHLAGGGLGEEEYRSNGYEGQKFDDGYFSFPYLRVICLPTSTRQTGVGLSYSFRLTAVSMDYESIPTTIFRESYSPANFNVHGTPNDPSPPSCMQ